MSIFVCFVFMLFVDICHEWACEFKDVKLFVCLVKDCDIRFEICDQNLWGDGAAPGSLVSREITVYCELL